ncbi:MAG TPA: TetR family transcriptional regulator [Streptosporangiaceae bacterium]|nr:TetR family transcriptional regulator [Streptosporangiaceae bacterium]
MRKRVPTDAPAREAAPKRALREELLDAAAALLTERGYRAVRMQDVADAVGVSRQTVYNEFDGKWGLAQALVLRNNDRYLDGVDEALNGHADLFSAVAAAAEFTLTTAADDPFQKAILTGTGGDDLLPLLTTQAEPVVFAARSRILEHVVRQWPEVDGAELPEIVDTAIRLTISHLVLPTEPPDVVARRIARVVIRYLRL